MIDTLVIKTFCDRNVNEDDIIITCLNLCMHNHFGKEILFPNRDVV